MGPLVTGLITSLAARIIPRAKLATLSAWLETAMGTPPTTMYASPMVSTWERNKYTLCI